MHVSCGPAALALVATVASSARPGAPMHSATGQKVSEPLRSAAASKTGTQAPPKSAVLGAG